MSDPIIPKGLEGLRMTAPRPNVIDILVANATASLELLGEMTGREPEAQALIKTIREEFGG